MGEAGERVEASKEKRSRSGSREVEKKNGLKTKAERKKSQTCLCSFPAARARLYSHVFSSINPFVVIGIVTRVES
jgi:hypothetical protein